MRAAPGARRSARWAGSGPGAPSQEIVETQIQHASKLRAPHIFRICRVEAHCWACTKYTDGGTRTDARVSQVGMQNQEAFGNMSVVETRNATHSSITHMFFLVVYVTSLICCVSEFCLLASVFKILDGAPKVWVGHLIWFACAFFLLRKNFKEPLVMAGYHSSSNRELWSSILEMRSVKQFMIWVQSWISIGGWG